jgi:hypothetical protein
MTPGVEPGVKVAALRTVVVQARISALATSPKPDIDRWRQGLSAAAAALAQPILRREAHFGCMSGASRG